MRALTRGCRCDAGTGSCRHDYISFTVYFQAQALQTKSIFSQYEGRGVHE